MNSEVMLELVDEEGRTIGQAEKLAAHAAPGRLHRAFSVFLFDEAGRILIQRRALTKYHSPGVWSNSCCGHPYPAEPPYEAAVRRVKEELGIASFDLQSAGTTRYHHPDPDSGLVEKEYNHLFVGTVYTPANPDPSEVAEITWLTPSELLEWRTSHPFSVWFGSVFSATLPTIRRWTHNSLWSVAESV